MANKRHTDKEKIYAKELGERLNRARLYRKKTLKEVRAGIDEIRSIAQLSNYEKGKSLPNPYIVVSIAKMLDVSPTWLFTGRSKKKKE